MGIYVSIHILAGIFIGFYAGLLPKKLNNYAANYQKIFWMYQKMNSTKTKRRKREAGFFAQPELLLLAVSVAVLIFTYLSPANTIIAGIEIIIMLIRSIVLTIIWYGLLAPIVKKIFQKYLSSKKSVYAKEIDEMMNMFPQFRKIVSYCWKNSQKKAGIKRIHYFLSTSFYYLILIK